MKEQMAKLIERFPNHASVIRALSGSDARFRDLLSDHHDLHQKLSRDETAADPALHAELHTRYRDLEEELIRLIQGYPMA